MNIYLGTTSDDKKNILQEALNTLNWLDFSIIGYKVDSGISDQPLNETITIQGACNRAKNALLVGGNNGIGIGLEGGLCSIDESNRYYLVCAACIVDELGNEYIGVSGKLALPKTVSDAIHNGGEFGIAIREYMLGISESDSRYQYGNELVTRAQSFSQAITNAVLSYQSK